MKISYKKLWYTLIDKNMTKSDLRRLTGISTTTIQKLTNGESVSLEILLRICEKLEVKIQDIVEFVDY